MKPFTTFPLLLALTCGAWTNNSRLSDYEPDEADFRPMPHYVTAGGIYGQTDATNYTNQASNALWAVLSSGTNEFYVLPDTNASKQFVTNTIEDKIRDIGTMKTEIAELRAAQKYMSISLIFVSIVLIIQTTKRK